MAKLSSSFDSLILGLYNEDGYRFMLAMFGTGFTNELLDVLTPVLEKSRAPMNFDWESLVPDTLKSIECV